jgi:predicted transcriptional regulator of viral defense system
MYVNNLPQGVREVMADRQLPPKAILRDADFLASKFSWRDVDEAITRGDVERIAPGTYVRTGQVDDDTATLASITLRKPVATICLLSALDRHDLTDAIPSRIDIAVPRGSRALTARHSRITWHQFDARTFSIGREQAEIVDGIFIGVYGAQRAIIDAFRIRHLIGGDTANEALKRWLRRPGSHPAELLKMAANFPKALPQLRNSLAVLL